MKVTFARMEIWNKKDYSEGEFEKFVEDLRLCYQRGNIRKISELVWNYWKEKDFPVEIELDLGTEKFKFKRHRE